VLETFAVGPSFLIDRKEVLWVWLNLHPMRQVF